MSIGRFTRFFIFLLTGILCIASATGGKKTLNNDSKRAKARYYYVKGAISEADGKNDEAYEYYKRAAEIDPGYEEASYAFGLLRTTLAEDTFSTQVEFRKDLSLMRPLLDKYPSDVTSAERYAYTASFADTLPEALRVYQILLRENPGLSRLYLPLSYFYMSVGKPDSAVLAIRELERLEGANTETTVRKVGMWLSRGDTVAALAEAKAYADANPTLPDALVDRAMIYNLLGRQDSAIFFLEKALEQFPDKSEMKFDIALLYAEKGDSVKFHRLVEEAFKGEDVEYEDRMAMLNVYVQNVGKGKEDYSESDRLFKYAETLYGEDADFYDQYATYELAKGDFKGALEKAEKALKLNPSEPTFVGRVMSFSIIAGNPKEGLTAFEKFPLPELRKEFSLILTYSAAAQEAGESEKALAWLDTLIRTETPILSLSSSVNAEKRDSVEILYDMNRIYHTFTTYEVAADIFAKTGKYDDAARSYENVIILSDSTDIMALNNYAYFLVDKMKAEPGSGAFEKAKQMSRKTLEKSSDTPQSTYLDTYAWILFKEGDYAKALEYQEMAIEAEEENSGEMLSHYGDMLFKSGREEEALEEWRKALELDPENKLLQRKVEEKIYIDD